MNRLRGIGLSLLSLVPLTAQATPVAEPIASGITVEGTGDATMPADMLEYRALLVLGGATPADAMVEYDRAVARLPKALDQLGMKELTYELRGVLISSLTDEQFRQRQRQAMSYGGQVPDKCEVKDHLTVRVPIEGLEAKDVHDTVVGILTLATELGLEDPEVRRMISDPYGRNLPTDTPENWTAGVSYGLRDERAIYAKAAESAVEDARAKAGLQAGLIGARLGRVVAVETLAGSRVEAGRMRDLRHRVVLRVRYELTVP